MPTAWADGHPGVDYELPVEFFLRELTTSRDGSTAKGASSQQRVCTAVGPVVDIQFGVHPRLKRRIPAHFVGSSLDC